MPIRDTKSLLFVSVILLFGCILGSILTELFIYILPSGVVKEFFTSEVHVRTQKANKNILIGLVSKAISVSLSLMILLMPR